jgi:hypothetical protein
VQSTLLVSRSEYSHETDQHESVAVSGLNGLLIENKFNARVVRLLETESQSDTHF